MTTWFTRTTVNGQEKKATNFKLVSLAPSLQKKIQTEQKLSMKGETLKNSQHKT